MKLFSRRFLATPALMFAVAFVSSVAVSQADEENVYWRSAAGNGNWANDDGSGINNWYRASDGYDVRRPDLANGQWSASGTKSYTVIHFDNDAYATTTINGDIGGAKYHVYRLLLENSSSRTFNSSSGAYLSMGGGSGAAKIESVSGSGTGSYTFNVPIFLEKDTEINAVGGNITISGAITNNGKTLISWTDTGKELQLTGVVSGSGAFHMKGAGLVTLSGANTYSGGTLVDNGEVKGSTTSLQGGITNNAKLTFDQTTSGSYAGTISGSGTFTKSGSGSVTLTGANTYSGATTISGGTLNLNATSGSALGSTASLTIGSGATLLISKSDQVNNSAGVTLSGGTIKRDSGVSEAFGNLNLTAASFLDYGSGTAGTLTFGSYTPSSLLTVNNFFEGNKLVFSSNIGSDINNTNYFKFDNGFTSNWNGSTFTITAIPEPSAYIAATGLIGLMLWRRKKRA